MTGEAFFVIRCDVFWVIRLVIRFVQRSCKGYSMSKQN